MTQAPMCVWIVLASWSRSVIIAAVASSATGTRTATRNRLDILGTPSLRVVGAAVFFAR
jgi:uncharacterized membrane protein YeiH